MDTRLFLACFSALLLLHTSIASHFRGGIITWRTLDPYSDTGNINDTRTIEISYRMTYSGECLPGQSWSVGSLARRTGFSGTIVNLILYCDQNIPVLGRTGVGNATYLPESSFEASFASAAWINLATGGGGWELRMKYKYIRRSGKMNSSPVTAMAEVVGVQHGCTYLIKIPVADYDGNEVRCRWARSDLGECSGVCQTFPGAILNEKTCELWYNSAEQSTGYYAVAIQIEDFSSTDAVPLSSIPLQFLVNVSSSSICGQEPLIIDASLPDGAFMNIAFNTEMSYFVKAQAFTNSNITGIFTTITPFGIQLMKSDPSVAATSTSQFTWTVNISWIPSVSDSGPHLFCYYAIDSQGLTSKQYCVTLNVTGLCNLKQHGCEQICIDTEEGYHCSCNKGFSLLQDGKSCFEIDDCAEQEHGCEQVCTDKVEGFECSCNKGFSLQDDGKSCVEIDECVTLQHGCEHICIDKLDGFNCACEDGFQLQSDGKTCAELVTTSDKIGIGLGSGSIVSSILLFIIMCIIISCFICNSRCTSKKSKHSDTSVVHCINTFEATSGIADPSVQLDTKAYTNLQHSYPATAASRYVQPATLKDASYYPKGEQQDELYEPVDI